MADILYSDTYNGPRFTYGLSYRPVGYGTVPSDFIVYSDLKHDRFKFGTIDYPRELTAREVSNHELTFVPDNEVALLAVLADTEARIDRLTSVLTEGCINETDEAYDALMAEHKLKDALRKALGIRETR